MINKIKPIYKICINKWINNDENRIIIQLYIAFLGTLSSFPLLSMWSSTHTNDFSKVSKLKLKRTQQNRENVVFFRPPPESCPRPFPFCQWSFYPQIKFTNFLPMPMCGPCISLNTFPLDGETHFLFIWWKIWFSE